MNLTKLIEKLASFETTGLPFISIYLNAQANGQGRDEYQIWLKNEFRENSTDFEDESQELQSFSEIEEKINLFLEKEVEDSANGIAIFASLNGDFFETVQLDEPFPNNRFFMFSRPHIFPLVRIKEQNPKYLALWADTNKADIYIFGGENIINLENETEAKVEEIKNEKTNRSQVGGWSQARYQRHVENYHLQHAKETVEEVERLMREQKIEHLILCGDETGVIPILKDQFSKAAEEKLVSVLNLSQYATEEEIRQKTREVMGIDNAVRDQEKVERMFNAAKAAAGLGTIGVDKTLAALSNGQVEELIISSTFDAIKYKNKDVKKVLEDYAPGDDNSNLDELPEVSEKRQIGDELLIRALNSSAKICFIEDESLLKDAGGVGAVLRYNINATANRTA
jgi:peptide chain release factor subunit 1